MRIILIVGCYLAVAHITFASPGRITNLSGVATNGGVCISWTAPTSTVGASLTNMDVRCDTSTISALNWKNKARVVWLSDPGVSGTTQTAVISDLAPDTTYYLAIKTQDSSGAWATMSNLLILKSGNTTYGVTLAWDPSTSSDVSKYAIYIGTGSGDYNTVTNIGNVTSCTVTGLLWGVTYYFVATAATSDGLESDPSNEVSIKRP